jgi:hypothetical protein
MDTLGLGTSYAFTFAAGTCFGLIVVELKRELLVWYRRRNIRRMEW